MMCLALNVSVCPPISLPSLSDSYWVESVHWHCSVLNVLHLSSPKSFSLSSSKSYFPFLVIQFGLSAMGVMKPMIVGSNRFGDALVSAADLKGNDALMNSINCVTKSPRRKPRRTLESVCNVCIVCNVSMCLRHVSPSCVLECFTHAHKCEVLKRLQSLRKWHERTLHIAGHVMWGDWSWLRLPTC